MHPTLEQLELSLETIAASPSKQGTVELIISRPETGKRVVHTIGNFSKTGGLEGDNWANDCWKTLPDGKSDPIVQIAITNTRLLAAICPDKSRWPLAGDQIYTELNLSKTNLPVGTRLSAGTVILEITQEPHLGCSQYAEHFGKDSLKFTLTPRGRELNLRGIYAKVIKSGSINTGDRISKID